MRVIIGAILSSTLLAITILVNIYCIAIKWCSGEMDIVIRIESLIGNRTLTLYTHHRVSAE